MDSENRSLIRFVAFIIIVSGFFIILLGIQSSAYIINSLLLAAMITLAVLPLPRALIRRGMRSSVAMIFTLLLIIGAFALFGALVIASVEEVTNNVAAGGPQPVSSGDGPTSPSDLLAWIESQVEPEDVSALLGQLLAAMGGIAAQFVAVLLIFVFMLSAAIGSSLSNQLEDAVGGSQGSAFTRLTNDVQRYLSITTVVNFCVGLGNTVLLLILDIPFAVLWGILAWLMGYIPSVGFILALIPPLLLAWVIYGLPTAAIVLVGYILINGSVENLVKPRIMGQGLNISPLIIFVSLFFWAWVLGGAGAILAVPLTLMVLSLLGQFEATRWITVLARPPAKSGEEDHERNEAMGRLRGVWDQASGLVRRDDGEPDSS